MNPDEPRRNEGDRLAEIECIAAEWIARRFEGLSPPQAVELSRWLAADRQHAAAFAELDETWQVLDRIRPAGGLVPADGSRPDPDALAPRRARRVAWWTASVPAAAAASLALAYVTWWRPSPPAAPFVRQAVTEIGAMQRLTLADGSVVQLNTDTVVNVVYTATERRIRLTRGEAHFTVTKNSARPFLVDAGNVAIRAVGTAFNVRRLPASIDVIVTEGKISLNDFAHGLPLLRPRLAAEPPLLHAGERAVVPAAASAATGGQVEAVALDPGELQRALAWQDRRLEFVAAPLDEIVAEFNRYHRRKLVIDDAALAAHRFGGSFHVDQPEIFVRLLETRFEIVAEHRADETVLRRARDAARAVESLPFNSGRSVETPR